MSLKDARGGLTSVMNVYLPSERLSQKEDIKQEELPDKMEDITE